MESRWYKLLGLTFCCTLVMIFDVVQPAAAQRAGYWQQHVSYMMNVHLNGETHKVNGHQKAVYTNHSPDTLTHIYYHLYFNAFQPGSMMDVRSRTLPDPDSRIGSRILHLNKTQIGYQHIQSLTQDGKRVNYQVQNTILEVKLDHPIAPGETSTFEMDFKSQVPLQIRRSGRDNKEGVDYSMTQWYPKIAEYTDDGWQTHPYVEREFIGVWGDFDVTITLDSAYTIGGTGYLENPQEVGHGYEDPSKPLDKPEGNELTWHFYAPNVHDFAWAADRDYTHEIYQVPDGPKVHILYIKSPKTSHWDIMGKETVESIEWLNKHVGTYPYKQYSVIQGGDGGMEYPMCTLINGEESERSLIGTMTHELTHNWFYGVLGSNESLYPFMDEGFTTHFSSKMMKDVYGGPENPLLGSYLGYLNIKYHKLEEPSITHADRFETNYAYGISSYSKPAAFLDQLSYIIGEKNFEKGIKRYFKTWKFKHPDPHDFKRVMEKQSGMELDWYFRFWLHSTDKIDYKISSVEHNSDSVKVKLHRIGDATLPIDLVVNYADGTKEMHNIPLGIMRGQKPEDPGYDRWIYEKDWAWTKPDYTVTIATAGKPEIQSIDIDPSNRLADVNRLNNRTPFPLKLHFMEPASPIDWDHYQASIRPAVWYGQQSGLRIGFTSSGSYLFGDKALDLDFFLTSGVLDDYQIGHTDVDYRLKYRHQMDNWGKETYLSTSLRRYYGIFEEYIELKKQLGTYGFLENTKRTLAFRAFHQAKTAERQVSNLGSGWERGDVYGFDFRFTYGNAARNGFTVHAVAATHRDLFSASYTEFSGNKTYDWTPKFSTRLGLAFGMGTRQLPRQYRWTVADPSPAQLWQNETFTSFYNLLGNQTARDLHLVGNGQNGLIGYGLSGIGFPDFAGNNYLTATVWNTYKPIRKIPLNLELFSGLGKSWNGVFLSDMPVFGDPDNVPLLFSVGAGASYDVSQINSIRRWTAQSRFLQKLNLSLRVPFYMNNLNQHSNFKPRFVFGLSERF